MNWPHSAGITLRGGAGLGLRLAETIWLWQGTRPRSRFFRF
jgi:hypothetical protein